MKQSSGIIVRCNNRILVCKRSTENSEGGKWAIPMGGIEEGETPEQQAVRLAKITQFEANKAAIEQEYRDKKVEAEKQTAETIQQTTDETLAKQREAITTLVGAIQSVEGGLTGIGSIAAGIGQIFDTFLQTGKSTVEQVQGIVGAISGIIAGAAQLSQELYQQEQERIDATQAAELASLEEGSAAYEAAKKRQAKADEDAARKQFETNKAFQIAQTVIAGVHGVVS